MVAATSSNFAQFSITGGLGYVPFTISGLTAYSNPRLESSSDGKTWTVVDQSVNGKDFWQTDFHSDR